MIELRPFKADDLLEIKDSLVEGRGEHLTRETANSLIGDYSFTFLKDGKVVACAGAGKIDDDITDGWALYSATVFGALRSDPNSWE